MDESTGGAADLRRRPAHRLTRDVPHARVMIQMLAAATVLVAGCRPELRPATVTPTAVAVVERVTRVPSLGDDGDTGALVTAVRASVAYYERLPPEQPFELGAERFTARRMRDALTELARSLDGTPAPEAIAREVDRLFVAYRATPPDGVLFTGYYLPALAARATRDARFRYPVLGRPRDLVTVATADFDATGCPAEIAGRVDGQHLRRYYTRAEITAGAVRDAPVLAWADDPVALFFLHVQGSGMLTFPNGRRMVGFAGSNGHPYVSIGKLLVDEGKLSADAASMQGIRSWLSAHPDEETRVLNANPRFVFFRALDGPAVGSLGVPVTAGRTIATDPAVYPPGVLAWANVPPTDAPAATPGLARWMLNQDRGAAIRGAGRVDVFLGAGAAAEEIAGRTHTRGELYLFAPR